MKKNFITAVESKDLVSVRVFLANELMIDPRGVSFNEMLSYAKTNMEGLFEADNGQSYTQDEALWDESLLFAVKNDLDANFSEPRLAFYSKIAPVVLKEKCEQLDKEEAHKASAAKSKGEAKQDPNGSFIPGVDNDQLFKTTAIAGAALTVLGCVTKGLVSGISTTLGVIGLVAGGGYLLYKKSQK